MKPFGPIAPDGTVEFPAGSGRRFPADGMLSRHPQCDAIRVVLANAGHPDTPDVPILIDKYAPLGTASWLDNCLIVNRPQMEIEKVWIGDTKGLADAIGLVTT